MSVLTVFITVFSLLVMVVPGFLLQKAKMFPEKAESVLSNLVLYGLQPFLLFMCFQNENIRFGGEILLNMLIVFGIALFLHFAMFFIGVAVFHGDNEIAKKRCARLSVVFSNSGYMGIPFLQMLFAGNAGAGEIMIYVAAALVAFNVLCWTLGVYIVSGDKRDISFKKVALNPTIIAVFLGLVSFLVCRGTVLSVIPEGDFKGLVAKLMDSFSLLGNAVTPVSMIVIGLKLAKIDFKRIFTEKLAYICCLLKLIVAPLISILAVAFLPLSTIAKYAIFFITSMPSATAVVMFAVRYNGDAEFGSVEVLLSTVLSIVTIPLMFLVMSGVFGIVIS